jgi:hypothetical protein
MNFIMRMTQTFAAAIVNDLSREHRFAHERVGFLYGSAARSGEDWLVLPVQYAPVDDDFYLNVPRVGASIDSRAIRHALQKTLDTGLSCFHVHLHPAFAPGFGELDLNEQDKLVPSFVAVNSRVPHGAVVLFDDGAEARGWLPGELAPRFARRVAIVGAPLQLSRSAR